MDAQLSYTTSGWFEVCLYDEPDEYGPKMVRRRHVGSLKLAEHMIVSWLDGSPAIWDRVFGDLGTREWYEREVVPK